MPKGTVKSFDEKKGWGVIIDDNTRDDIRVHISVLRNIVIKSGDRVEFDYELTAKNILMAINIRIIS